MNKKIRQFLLFASLAFVCAGFLTCEAQVVSIKNNLVYDATLTPNLSIEFKLSKRLTLDMYGGYNPFPMTKKADSSPDRVLGEGLDPNFKRFRHWLVQPELRYWLCEAFNGMFLGLHGHLMQYNVAGVKLPLGIFPSLEHNRYMGWGYGAGFSFGNQWILSNRWNIEASLGAGFIRFDRRKSDCAYCAPIMHSESRNYFGITRATVSIIYLIK